MTLTISLEGFAFYYGDSSKGDLCLKGIKGSQGCFLALVQISLFASGRVEAVSYRQVRDDCFVIQLLKCWQPVGVFTPWISCYKSAPTPTFLRACLESITAFNSGCKDFYHNNQCKIIKSQECTGPQCLVVQALVCPKEPTLG